MSTSKKILIVEDNEDCRDLQARVIRRLGYVVIEADNGAAAIEVALAAHPDLILMDLSLPKMSGEDAIVQLKNQPSTRDIPVIICTAYDPGPRVEGRIGVRHNNHYILDSDPRFLLLDESWRVVQKFSPPVCSITSLSAASNATAKDMSL